MILWMVGRRNARVLPVPVLAWATLSKELGLVSRGHDGATFSYQRTYISFPSKAGLTLMDWTSVMFSYPMSSVMERRMFWWTSSDRRSAKRVMVPDDWLAPFWLAAAAEALE